MLDHGVLNIPLARRSNINADLDAYNVQQAIFARAKRRTDAAARRALKLQARDALAALLASPALLDDKAAELGVKRKQLVEALHHWRTCEPATVIQKRADWMGVQS